MTFQKGCVSNWEVADIVTLLTQGQHRQAYVAGPMAEVVRNSTQYLEPGDAMSMALYLQTLNKGAAAPNPRPSPAARTHMGAKNIRETIAPNAMAKAVKE